MSSFRRRLHSAPILLLLSLVVVSSFRRRFYSAPIILLLSLVVVSCTSGSGDEADPRSGTERMAERLEEIYRQAYADPMPYLHMNRRRADVWREEMGRTSGRQKLRSRYYFALELLNAGETEAAIAQMDTLLAAMLSSEFVISPEARQLYELLAVSYLRLGEQQNCIQNHSAESCIFPLAVGGEHQLTEGSRAALEIYETLLTHFPGEPGLRWLYNVAAVTLGRYPHDVPEEWLIPGLGGSEEPRIPRFRNVALTSGVAVNALSGGVSLEDFDGDGHLDLFVTSYGLNDPARYFRGIGSGRFEDATAAAGLDGIVSGLNTIHGDYDNDGFVDVLILRGAWLGEVGAHPNSLLRNRGDGTFEDVTEKAGLLSFHPTQAAAWADVDNDSHLDLFIGNESDARWSRVWRGDDAEEVEEGAHVHKSELYLNNGDGTFTEVASQYGIDVSEFVKGVAWGDINNDGLPDLYISVLGGPNLLYVNRGDRFEEMAAVAGVGEPNFSFPAWFFDYDNDGFEDLFVASYDLRRADRVHEDVAREFLGMPVPGEKAKLYRNNGDGTFADVTEAAGLNLSTYAMGAAFGDLDNDGYPDIYLGTGAPDLRSIVPNRMFLNRGGERFDDVTFDGGFGHIQKGHAIAFADVDGDGDQDIYAVMGGSVEGDYYPNTLFENPGPPAGHAWVTFRLEGRTANRSAIGARITVAVAGADKAERSIFKTVSTGGSFGASSLQQEIGLGPAERIVRLEIRWPNSAGTVDVFEDLEVNRVYRIVEGGELQTIN